MTYVPSNTSTTARINVGGTGYANGRIDYEFDHDWFAVTLVAGRSYRFDFEGLHTGAGTLHDPYLGGIYDSDGNLIPGTTNDDAGWGFNSRVTFTPETSGTYYAAARDYGHRTGTYRLAVTDVTDDDYSYGTASPGAVEIGGHVKGTIESSGDSDWFAVTLVAGRTYRFDLEGSDTRAGNLRDPYLSGIYAPNGNPISGTRDDNGGVGNNSRVEFTPDETGIHHVAAWGLGAPGIRIGTYRLSATDITPADDYSSGTDTTGAVRAGGRVRGEIEPGDDSDWFAVSLEAGRTYRFNLEGSETGVGTLSDPYLRGIYDSNGNQISGTTDDNGGAGRNSRVDLTADGDGTYYVSAGAAGIHRGTYRLSVTDVTAEDDYTAGTGRTGTVEIGGHAEGEIDFGDDMDWFAVTLVAGRFYQFNLEGSETGVGTLSDPYLRGIYDSNGNQIPDTTNNNGGAGRNSRLGFSPDASGTYYVSAGAFHYREGTYRLSVTDATPPGDHTGGTDTSGAVLVDGHVLSAIEFAGDKDWFAVTLQAGRTYRFDLEGSETDAGTLSDPYLRGIYDFNGNQISGTTDDNGGAGDNSRVEFTPDSGGTYYVSAGADGTSTGTYRLYMTVVTAVNVEDVHTAGIDTSGTVGIGGHVEAAINIADDRDWFAVTLEPGRTYRFDLEGSVTDAGTLSDPYLRGIYDSNGNQIPGTTDDDGGVRPNSRVEFTPNAGGTYYVAAGAWSDEEGTYRLSVTDVSPVDDYSAGTDRPGAVEVGGHAQGEIEFWGDRDWFAVTLEAGGTYRIDLEGYPTHAGTLGDPYLRGIYDSNGNQIPGTTDDDGGPVGYNSRVNFSADVGGTYYVSAGAYASGEGTYRLSVEEVL